MASKDFFGNRLSEDEAELIATEEHEHKRIQNVLRELLDGDGSNLRDFLHWWLNDGPRSQCYLHQAVSAYFQSFPARTLPLIQELIEAKANEPS